MIHFSERLRILSALNGGKPPEPQKPFGYEYDSIEMAYIEIHQICLFADCSKCVFWEKKSEYYPCPVRWLVDALYQKDREKKNATSK